MSKWSWQHKKTQNRGLVVHGWQPWTSVPSIDFRYLMDSVD